MASGDESGPSPDKKIKLDTELDDDNVAAYEDPRSKAWISNHIEQLN
jgi:hypothetical protein